jgi:hypothetical protein
MTETFFGPHDVAQLVSRLSGLPAGARVRLGPGRFLLPEPIVLTNGIELVGEPGKTILDGQEMHTILAIDGEQQLFTLRGLTFANGVGTWGGAISSGAPNRLFLDQCRFTKNRASEDGGAVFLRAATGTRIVRCTFEMNAARRAGGALDVGHRADVLVDRCVFRANEAQVGGGVCLSGTGALELRNCTFLENRAIVEPGGGSFFVTGAASSGPSAYVSNTIFAGRDAIASDPSTQYKVFFTHSIVPPDLFQQRGFQDLHTNTLGTPDLVQLGEGAWGLAPGSNGARTADTGRIEEGATDLLGRPLVRDGVADPGALAYAGP